MLETVKPKDSTITVIIGIITLVLALLAIAVLVVVPAAYNLLLSLKDFRIPSGIFGSPWIGLKNFEYAFSHPFVISLRWTFLHAFIASILLFVASVATGYILTAVGKARWLRHALCTLLLIPMLIPAEIWVQAFVDLKLYRLISTSPEIVAGSILSAWCAIKYIGLPALLVTAAASHGKRTWSVPLMAGGAVSLALFALLGRFDIGFMRQMPPTLYAVLGIESFTYRISLMSMQYGVGASINVLLSLISGILMAIVAFPVAIMVRRLFPADKKPDETRMKDRLVSLAIPGAVAVLAAIALSVSAFSSGFDGSGMQVYANLPIYIILAFVGAAVNTVLCYLLARSAVCSGKVGNIILTAVLVLLTAIGQNTVPLGEYMLFRSMGFMSTWFAILFSGMGTVWGVWPLVFAAKGMGVATNADWFRRMWKPAIALFAIQAALMMNDTLPSMLYMSRADQLHPLMILLRGGMAGSPPNVALSVLLAMAVPVALLLIVRTVMNEKDSLGLFLPGR